MEIISGILGKLKKTGVKKAFNNVVWFIVAAVFSPAVFILDSLPFGIALVAAASGNTVAIISGTLAGALLCGELIVPYIISIAAAVILRLYISKGRFNEPIAKRVIISFASSILFEILKAIFVKTPIKEISTAIATIAFAGLFAFLYSVRFSPDKANPSLVDSGKLAVIFTLIYVFNDIDIYGFIPSVVAAYLVTVFNSKTNGFMKGGIVGLITGLACGADALIYAPLLGICGLLCGILSHFSDTVAISSVLFTSMVYTIYASNMTGVESTFQNVILVIILFVPLNLIYRKFGKVIGIKKDKIKIYDYAMPAFASAGAVNEKIGNLSKVYGELSDAFSGMGKHQTAPDAEELGGIIKSSMTELCKSCPNKGSCTHRRMLLEQTVKLVKKYTQKSKLIPDSKSVYFPQDCNGQELISKINSEYKKKRLEKIQKDRCFETSQSMADISRVLKSISDGSADMLPNPEVAEKISETLAELNIRTSGVYAEGFNGITVYAYDVIPTDISIGVKQLSKAFSDACKTEFSLPKLTKNGKTYTLVVQRAPKYIADISSSQISLESDSLCGDSSCNIKTSSAYYSVICDGMGSGADAAATSRMACIMLEKLVGSGCDVKVAIDMINKLLINKFDEVFTTLDILQIDIFSGESSLYKAGAAASIIIRNGKKYELSSYSTPAGIVDEISAENIKLRLRAEDLIIMMSDGALDALGGTDAVYDKVISMMPSDSETICSKLTELSQSSETRHDDISINVIKIRARY